MKSFATPKFWQGLPEHIQRIAQKQYLLWQSDPRHPSLQFKSIGQLWSVRVTQDYRALALFQEGAYYWIWIGTHAEYDQILRGK
jgi:hypothetical protein